jgi:hypothetical protein
MIKKREGAEKGFEANLGAPYGRRSERAEGEC